MTVKEFVCFLTIDCGQFFGRFFVVQIFHRLKDYLGWFNHGGRTG